jgi:hypothetical protein
MDFVPKERATPIREPSTANLLIDSIDRTDGVGSADFTITKKQNILNGFFTRLAVVEVVLDWCIPNINPVFKNDVLTYNVGTESYSITIPEGHYTIARLLNTIKTELNVQSIAEGLGITWSVTGNVNDDGYATLSASGDEVSFPVSPLQTQLNLASEIFANDFPVDCPAVLPITYLDFTCDQLTYNQELKDEATNLTTRNTLYRWVFAWDEPSPVDSLGYPVFQGYLPFRTRRYLAFPKQVRWETNMPIGQLNFQVYDSQGELVPTQTGEMEWNMLLQVSEV